MSAWTAREEGKVRVLLFSRPPGNTLLKADLDALASAVREPGSARALVLGSSTPKYFSSGLDLEPIVSADPSRRAETFEALLGAYKALLLCPRPVVGALSGAALLGGWILAMACDFRVLASDTGKVALSEVRLGLSPTRLLVSRLSALCKDPRLTKEMVLRGSTIRAEEAFAAGLADELAPESEVLARAVKLAGTLAKAAPNAYASVKSALNAPFLDEALWRQSLQDFKDVITGPEGSEGLAAMKEKRRPRWDE